MWHHLWSRGLFSRWGPQLLKCARRFTTIPQQVTTRLSVCYLTDWVCATWLTECVLPDWVCATGLTECVLPDWLSVCYWTDWVCATWLSVCYLNECVLPDWWSVCYLTECVLPDGVCVIWCAFISFPRNGVLSTATTAWDGSTSSFWPTHSPCGNNAADHVAGLTNPRGRMLLRDY